MPCTPGNSNAEVLGKLRVVWLDGTLVGRRRALIIILANACARTVEMVPYLSEDGVTNNVATGQGKIKVQGEAGSEWLS
jgi:hypothetical protein